MTFEIIVFSQEELDKAVGNGISLIALCDNRFILPPLDFMSYTAIGNVEASIEMTSEEFLKSHICCMGFEPKTTGKCAAAPCVKAAAAHSSLSSSYASSYLSSYFLSSYFVTSYRYRYEYEFRTSSYTTSYMTSYTTSYTTSYAASYTASYISSYTTSYITSYGTSCAVLYAEPYDNYGNNDGSDDDFGENRCIMVNGYGINLI
jgi:hypothetical protein